MKSVRTTLAYLAAAALVVFGLLALLNPLVAARLVGLEVVEPRGLSEIRASYGAMILMLIRASYGAMILMLGGIMVWAVPMRPRSAPWMRLAGLLWTAATLGRAASVLLDGVWTPVNLLFLLASGVIAVAFVLASFQTPGRERRRGQSQELDRDRDADRASRPVARRGWLRRSNDRSAKGPGGGDETAEDDDDPLRAYRS